jgi:hypothetical protein
VSRTPRRFDIRDGHPTLVLAVVRGKNIGTTTGDPTLV